MRKVMLVEDEDFILQGLETDTVVPISWRRA